MENLFSASAALDEDTFSDSDMTDQESTDGDDIADILLLAGVGSMEDVLTMSGDGSQGQCGQIPKSKDWFAVALMSPDYDFCCTFRYFITRIPTA
jgi:hypothetical protein